MSDVPVRELVSAMSRLKKSTVAPARRLSRAGLMDELLAITSTGLVLLNAKWFDSVETAEDALRRALREPSRVFVGVALDNDEVNFVIDHLHELVHEPIGPIIGGRQRRERGLPPLMPSSRGRRS